MVLRGISGREVGDALRKGTKRTQDDKIVASYTYFEVGSVVRGRNTFVITVQFRWRDDGHVSGLRQGEIASREGPRRDVRGRPGRVSRGDLRFVRRILCRLGSDEEDRGPGEGDGALGPRQEGVDRQVRELTCRPDLGGSRAIPAAEGRRRRPRTAGRSREDCRRARLAAEAVAAIGAAERKETPHPYGSRTDSGVHAQVRDGRGGRAG